MSALSRPPTHQPNLSSIRDFKCVIWKVCQEKKKSEMANREREACWDSSFPQNRNTVTVLATVDEKVNWEQRRQEFIHSPVKISLYVHIHASLPPHTHIKKNWFPSHSYLHTYCFSIKCLLVFACIVPVYVYIWPCSELCRKAAFSVAFKPLQL